MHISVAIVTYHSAAEIGPCLESIARETRDYTCQVVIVDNASVDDSSRSITTAIKHLTSKSLTFLFLENDENLGFTKALNQALVKCTGDLILILNPDTEMLNPCLSGLIAALEQDAVGVVAPQLLNLDGSIQRSCRRFPNRSDVLLEVSGLSYLFPNSKVANRWKMGEFDHKTLRSVEQPQGAFLLFSRALLNEVGLWDESFPMFFSDVDWCYRIKQAGYDILFVPDSRVHHHKGASVHRTRIKMIWTSHRSFYQYFKKHKNNILFANQLLGFILLVTAVLRIVFHLSARR